MRRMSKILLAPVCMLWIAGCSGVQTNSGGGNLPQVTVSVTPPSPTVPIFGTQTFSARVTGSSNTAVTWEVDSVIGGSQAKGYISSAGVYTAPSGVPTKSNGNGDSVVTTVMVTAVSQANPAGTGSATVTVTSLNQGAQSGAVKLGTSGGNINDTNSGFCCGGTLGSLVTRNKIQYILSNNHVLAKSDNGIIGDPINQPGLMDAPNTCLPAGTTTVAHLSEFFNLQTGPMPIVDAALAQVVGGQVDANGNILLLGNTITNGVPDPGAPRGGAPVTSASTGQAVAKSGRTTGLTCSTVLATGIGAKVDYFKNCGDTTKAFTVTYTDLVSVAGGGFSAGGDSGALIVTQNTADPVALLLGGSDTDTVGNAISDVLAAFPGAGNLTPTFVGSGSHQVIGCTLPIKPAAVTVPLAAPLSAEAIRQANMVRDQRASELLANPAVRAIAVGKSYDHPGQAAILLFVSRGESQARTPKTLDGVPTRVIEGEDWARQGLLTNEESAQLLANVSEPQVAYALQPGEMERARIVNTAHAAELLKQAEILGVGITSSMDAPGEAALMIYLKHGAPQDGIPVVMDGLRTRVRETSPFRSGRDGANSSQGCRIPAASGIAKTNR